jgi:acyl-CoA thioester hydrolase
MVYDARGPVPLHPVESVGPGRVEVPADPRDLPGTFGYRRLVEVRFGDTDAMGHVNNAVFLTYVELARAGYYRAAAGGRVGIGATERDQSFILADARLTFRSPAFFGEFLTAEARTAHVGTRSFTTEFRITAPESAYGAARLVVVASSVQVGYDYDAGRVRPIRDDLVAALEAFEGRRLRD